MRQRNTWIGSLSVAVLCTVLVTPAVEAADSGVQLIEISGPEAMLERGLPADSPPIFAAVFEPDAEAVELGGPDDYGTNDFVHYTAAGTTAFNPANSDATGAVEPAPRSTARQARPTSTSTPSSRYRSAPG